MRLMYFKELAHIIVGMGNSEICRADDRLEIRVRADVVQDLQAGNLGRVSVSFDTEIPSLGTLSLPFTLICFTQSAKYLVFITGFWQSF